MRILILNTNYYPYISGGAEISTQLLAETLSALGNEVWICTIADTEKREVVNGVNVIYTNYRNVYWAYKGTKSKWKKSIWHFLDIYNYRFEDYFRKLIDEIKPDVIHTNNICGFSCVVWHVVKSMKIPIVHTLRDYYLLCYKSTMFKNGKTCTKQCTKCKWSSMVPKMISQNIDGVVGISHFILDKHLKCGYFSKTKYREVIYNSIEKTKSTADRDPYTIGYMGSILPSKGVERLISDFSKLDNKNYTLEIAGDCNTDYVAYLKNKYSSPNIKFLGRVSAKDFLSHISLLVVPSEWHEPFGRVVGEAIMAGCPVFVSNRGGMPELVNHENGRVFSLEEKDSLFNLLSDYVRGKMHFSFDIKDNQFDRLVIANEYMKIYKKLLSDKDMISIQTLDFK